MAATSTRAPSAVQPQPEAPQPHPTPATQPPPPTEKKQRGNPNLGLAPRCGARTRAGCPCRAPAIRGKLRCRMHGGRSTGPRTAKGLARLRAAHTIHGCYTAEARAQNRKILTQAGRNRIALEAIRRRDRLLPELVARLNSLPAGTDATALANRRPDPRTGSGSSAGRGGEPRTMEARYRSRPAGHTPRGRDNSRRTGQRGHRPDKTPCTRTAARRRARITQHHGRCALGHLARKTPCTRSSRAPPADAAASAKQHGRDRGGNTPCTRSAKAPPADAATSAKPHRRDRGGNTPCTRSAKAPPTATAAPAKRHRRHYGGNTPCTCSAAALRHHPAKPPGRHQPHHRSHARGPPGCRDARLTPPPTVSSVPPAAVPTTPMTPPTRPATRSEPPAAPRPGAAPAAPAQVPASPAARSP